jgi:hypothetical protein
MTVERSTSTLIVSAFRATSIVDTPMRKVEVLESENGQVILRETDFSFGRGIAVQNASVHLIHLEHEEAQTLARVIVNLENQPSVSPARNGKRTK